MIGRITGRIVDLSPTKAIVDVAGIGYILHCTPSHTEKLSQGKESSFWTHLAVRENDLSLYGFGSEEELKMFESLLTVSGIGPKSALAVLGVAGREALEDAIVSGNTSVLTKIAGVGKKTADKIVLELSGKVTSSKVNRDNMNDNLDVLEALQALGYRDHQIKEILKEIPEEAKGTNDRIKQALKLLGKK